MKAVHKELILLGGVLLFSLIFWLSLATFLPVASQGISPFLWSATVAAILLMIFWSLTVILVESTIPLLVIWALSSYIGVLWFPTPAFIVGATLLFLAGIGGFYRTKSLIQKTLEGGLVAPIRRALPLMVTFLVITISIAAYEGVPRGDLVIRNLISEQNFHRALVVLEPTIRAFDGAFRNDRTIVDYTRIKAERATDTELTDEQVALLITELKKRHKSQFGIDLDENATLSHVIYVSGTDFLQKRFDVYRQILPIALSVSLFFTLRVGGFFLGWLAIMITVMTLRLLHRFAIVELRAIPATITAYSFP